MDSRTVVAWMQVAAGAISIGTGYANWRAGRTPGRDSIISGATIVALGVSMLTAGWVRYAAWTVMAIGIVWMTRRLFTGTRPPGPVDGAGCPDVHPHHFRDRARRRQSLGVGAGAVRCRCPCWGDVDADDDGPVVPSGCEVRRANLAVTRASRCRSHNPASRRRSRQRTARPCSRPPRSAGLRARA